MSEFLRALVDDPGAVIAAVRGSGLAPRECAAVAREAGKVLRKVTVKTRYDDLHAFLCVAVTADPRATVSGNADAP